MSALLFVSTATILDLSGCAGGPNRVAYQAAATSRLTVQEAMGLFNVWVGQQTAKGADTKPTELKVKAAFEKWKAAELAVLDAGKLNAIAAQTNATGQTGVAALFENAIANAAQYKADLFSLLTEIGVKLPV